MKSNIIYVNQDKFRRAEDIYALLVGRRPKDTNMSSGHKEHLVARFSELLGEADIDIKKAKESDVVDFIYRQLAGATRTVEQAARIKERAQTNKIGSSKEKEEAPEKDEDDDEPESDDE